MTSGGLGSPNGLGEVKGLGIFLICSRSSFCSGLTPEKLQEAELVPRNDPPAVSQHQQVSMCTAG